MAESFGLSDPSSVNLNTADPRAIVCYINAVKTENNGQLSARILSIFLIFITAAAATFSPVVATRARRLHVPVFVYLFARYFGAGVIVATAFIHLLQPAYEKIGSGSCVGMTGGWTEYSWPPAIALSSALVTFVMHFGIERYVEKRYRVSHSADGSPTQNEDSVDTGPLPCELSRQQSTSQGPHSSNQGRQIQNEDVESKDVGSVENANIDSIRAAKEKEVDIEFRKRIAAFLILEFGVMFHSAIIGLTLGTAGSEFSVLFPIIVFHQAFEGLGIGARLSAIQFPRRLRYMPWLLCIAYGLTTPVAIAVGLGLRTTYDAGSFTANIVSGVLDSVSAGILIYSGFVELIAKDFFFNPDRPGDDKALAFMVISLLLGAGIMALLGKWA